MISLRRGYGRRIERLGDRVIDRLAAAALCLLLAAPVVRAEETPEKAAQAFR